MARSITEDIVRRSHESAAPVGKQGWEEEAKSAVATIMDTMA